MGKFGVTIYFGTSCYREVEAKDKMQAYDQACLAVDGTSDEDFRKEIVKNLHNVDDPQIIEIKD